ncbi:maintenance of mitochondrial structure and function-domain-containing protein [Globomyces pollinis-pini]|nr:maintenance of mitochondrial structure and function-domain-containing protein [Globomyces pollinis-pini]
MTVGLSTSTLNLKLHPLVILNISDHFVRFQSQQKNASLVIGSLMGIQNGRDIEIMNSFELPLTQTNDINIAYFIEKQEQYKQVFPTLDVLGWYGVGSAPSQHELKLHQQFFEVNESPLFLQFDATQAVSKDLELPIGIYESFVDTQTSQIEFTKMSYKIVSEEAERIAVEHVAHSSTSSEKTNKLVSHLNGQYNAIKMLYSRILLLTQYMKDVQEGILPRDHDTIRKISSLCGRLPAIQGSEFDSEFNKDYSDVVLISYLAMITKSTEELAQVLVIMFIYDFSWLKKFE